MMPLLFPHLTLMEPRNAGQSAIALGPQSCGPAMEKLLALQARFLQHFAPDRCPGVVDDLVKTEQSRLE